MYLARVDWMVGMAIGPDGITHYRRGSSGKLEPVLFVPAPPEIGYEEGAICNRDSDDPDSLSPFCEGVMEYDPAYCTCFQNAPCSGCWWGLKCTGCGVRSSPDGDSFDRDGYTYD